MGANYKAGAKSSGTIGKIRNNLTVVIQWTGKSSNELSGIAANLMVLFYHMFQSNAIKKYKYFYKR